MSLINIYLVSVMNIKPLFIRTLLVSHMNQSSVAAALTYNFTLHVIYIAAEEER